MSERNDGGPAFPVPDGDAHGMRGMTLRDYFASRAMAAFVWKHGYGLREVLVAQSAYKMADAMLAAREATEAEE